MSQQEKARILVLAFSCWFLDEEIQAFMFELDDNDVRLKMLNERRLRPIAQIKDREEKDREEQVRTFLGLSDGLTFTRCSQTLTTTRREENATVNIRLVPCQA